MGDLANKFYGNGVRIFTGIIGLVFSILIVSTQLHIIGKISSDLLLVGVPIHHVIIGVWG